ncbi:O-antigen polymerase [Francisella sp. TX07-6608]|uniref:O-antigen polymerase n=1 Tax=Francisella sp. TX07-6608 TaxID=573568 RepID=UPI0008F9DCDB|nr:O-antigen polymerase [Francisella sp. TX07-6608]OIN84280.1 oligosaccharide repeat unit polymerase family protein [Francisella sp. TX07-6608]
MIIEYLITGKLLSVVFSFMILINAICIKKYYGSYFYPSAILSLFLFVYTFISLVICWDIPINFISILYIWLCSLVSCFGTLLFNWNNANRANTDKIPLSVYFDNRKSYIIFTLLFFITIILYLENLKIQGFSLGDFLSNFKHSSALYAQIRYEKKEVPNYFMSLSLVLNYSLVILAGCIVFCTCFKKSKMIIIFLAFIPSLIITLTQSQKGPFLLSFVFFLGSYIVSRRYEQELSLLSKKEKKFLFFATFFILIVIMITFFTRGMNFTFIYSYAFGHIYAFSDWLSFYLGYPHVYQDYDEPNNLFYGFYTFMSLYNAIGISYEVPLGIYSEYPHIHYLTTNIFMIFRGNIQDFGMVGTLLYWTILGMISNYIYYMFLKSRRPGLYMLLYIYFFVFCYYVFLISVFTWSSPIISIVLTYSILILLKFKIKA